MSPSARTLAECRRRGWTAQVVERFNSYTKRRIDLFGVIDIVVIADGRILGIQATSGSNSSSRVRKIAAEPRAKQWIDAGAGLEVWSWAKRGPAGKRKTWTLRTVAVGAADFTEAA